MKKFLLLLTVTLTALPAFANLGDTRADSAQRYGQPTSGKGNYANYIKGNWFITEWFNSTGFAVDICYYKHDGTISKKESDQLSIANFPSIPSWYPITAHGDPKKVQARIFLSKDSDYRFEIGSVRLSNRWVSYLELSTTVGHSDMVQDNEQHQDDDTPRQVNNDELPL